MFDRNLQEIQEVLSTCPMSDVHREKVDLMLESFKRSLEQGFKDSSNGNGHVVETAGKRIFIAIPHHSAVEADAVMRATSDAVPRAGNCAVVHRPSSLLCHCFNTLWTDCLNEFEMDYFLLNHADLFSMNKYAMRLVEELEDHKFDVIHAVAAIKDNFGLTSTAAMTMDPWDIPRRLTMFELEKCPGTFGIEEMIDAMGREDIMAHGPGPWFMGPNTGMLLIKLRNDDGSMRDWVYKFPGFTILDRIVRVRYPKLADGSVDETEWTVEPMDMPLVKDDASVFHLRPQVLSEDWNFGRWCYQNGLKVGATKNVETFHAGTFIWTNRTIWGSWCQDEHWLDRDRRNKARLEMERKEDPLFPYDVRGWLTQLEGQALRRWASGKRVLEIGSYCAKSTICLAQSADTVHCVDPFDGQGTPLPRETLKEFKANLDKWGVASKVLEHVGTSEVVLPKWPCYQDFQGMPKFDLVHIDGAHDAKSVRKDIEHSLRVLAKDGLLAFHDYRRAQDPDVTKVVDEFIARGAEIVELINDHKSNSHAVLIRPPTK